MTDKDNYHFTQAQVISRLISEIARLQTGPDSALGEGLFLSSRENRRLNYRRKDSSVFGTASVAFILLEILEKLPETDRSAALRITEKARAVYHNYRNKDGLETYNFWETKPGRHFPHGHIFRRMDHFRLPDDVDDTVLIYMNLDHSPEQNLWLKEKLKQHAGPDGIYSTWFGKNMPHEKDLCVMANLMYWVYRERLPLNDFDLRSLDWMKGVIKERVFLQQPFRVARHYASVPLIIYHLARLLGRFDVARLASCRSFLKQQAIEAFEKEENFMNKVLLSTALRKFGIRDHRYTPDFACFSEGLPGKESSKEFYSFIGALLGPYSHPLARAFAGSVLTRINWKCEAHELALCLENIVLWAEVS